MATVPLKFIPPMQEGIAFLRIYESSQPDSGFTQIERIPAGIYPIYIDNHTTTLALDATDWFAIQWEDVNGSLSELSSPIKGGTTTLVGEVVERVMLRLPLADENIVVQEVEATLSFVYRVDDPYTLDPDNINRLWMTEITNLSLVAVQYMDAAVGSSSTAGTSYTAGSISESSSSGSSGATQILQTLERIEKRALKRLGLGGSLIGSIMERQGIELTRLQTTFDSSRILSARQVITEHAIVQDLDSGIVISDR